MPALKKGGSSAKVNPTRTGTTADRVEEPNDGGGNNNNNNGSDNDNGGGGGAINAAEALADAEAMQLEQWEKEEQEAAAAARKQRGRRKQRSELVFPLSVTAKEELQTGYLRRHGAAARLLAVYRRGIRILRARGGRRQEERRQQIASLAGEVRACC